MFFATQTLPAQSIKTTVPNDVFIHTVTNIPPQGTNSYFALIHAPNPKINIAGEETQAKIVVNLDNNVLYTYNNYGEPEMAYRIASGKKSTPTHTGIRIVTNIESYPYRSAGKATKRYKTPRDYGPKALILQKVDPLTGKLTPTGEFIHGNNNKNSLGTYASKGCMRMDNEVIKEIAKQVKKGDYILIIKGQK